MISKDMLEKFLHITDDNENIKSIDFNIDHKSNTIKMEVFIK